MSRSQVRLWEWQPRRSGRNLRFRGQWKWGRTCEHCSMLVWLSACHQPVLHCQPETKDNGLNSLASHSKWQRNQGRSNISFMAIEWNSERTSELNNGYIETSFGQWLKQNDRTAVRIQNMVTALFLLQTAQEECFIPHSSIEWPIRQLTELTWIGKQSIVTSSGSQKILDKCFTLSSHHRAEMLTKCLILWFECLYKAIIWFSYHQLAGVFHR